MNQYNFAANGSQEYKSEPDDAAPVATDAVLDDLIHRKSLISASKLEVLATALAVRVDILKDNLIVVDYDRQKVHAALAKVCHEIRYFGRERRDENVLHQSLLKLEQERRTQAAECWRDIVMVLRDFLGVWEAHQQAQARAIFLDDAGR